MITYELGELYGCDNYKQLMEAVECMKCLGYSDEEIQKKLEESKTKKED